MKNLSPFRLILFFLSSFPVFWSSMNVHAQIGRAKTIADTSFGSGGSKSVLSKKNSELVIYRAPNQVRRLIENIRTIAVKGDSVKTTAKMYFDNTGKKNYFTAIAINKKLQPLWKVQAQFSADKLVSAAAWKLEKEIGVAFNYNMLTKKFETGARFPDEVAYKPDLSLGMLKGVKAPKLTFSYSVTGTNHYTSKVPNDEYKKGTESTDAYMDFDDYSGQYVKIEHKELFDSRGVLRHELYREYYEDGWVYEEETYYDCYGDKQYYGETWYDNYDGYEYEVEESYYKKGKKTAGYYYCDDYYYGDEETYDPVTGEWVDGWNPDLNIPEDFKPGTDDCPDTDSYWGHEFFGGVSIVREDDGADGFYIYGFEGSYTRNLSNRIGITGDLGINFRQENDTKLTKIIALAGATYWAKKANYSNPFTISLHVLAGVSNVRYNYNGGYGSFKSSDSYFTVDAGLGLGYYLTDKLGISLRLDALPTFAQNNTSINARASLGVILRPRMAGNNE